MIAAGGEVTVSTEVGKGSTFAISVPTSVTTQIMSGYVVTSGGHRYVLQMNRVQRGSVRRPARVGEKVEDVRDGDRVQSKPQPPRTSLRNSGVQPRRIVRRERSQQALPSCRASSRTR